MTVFAEALKKVPVLAEDLEQEVKCQKWAPLKQEHALQIVHQIQSASICEPEATIKIVDGRFAPIFLTLVSSDLDRISVERNKYKIIEYVKGLIEDVNSIAYQFVLEYDKYQYDRKRDVFEAEIYWYI